MRLLEGPRPHIHIFVMVVLALEGEGAGPRPGLDHEVVRLGIALVRMRRVDAEIGIFGADAADEAADQPPAGDGVDHRMLFGERQRMVAQAEGAAHDGDLGVLGAPRQARGGDDRRRHQAIGRLVMLVHHDAVEAELVAQLQLVEIAVIERVALGRIVLAVGQGHPIALVAVHHRIGQALIGHQVEIHHPHGRASVQTLSPRGEGRVRGRATGVVPVAPSPRPSPRGERE